MDCSSLKEMCMAHCGSISRSLHFYQLLWRQSVWRSEPNSLLGDKCIIYSKKWNRVELGDEEMSKEYLHHHTSIHNRDDRLKSSGSCTPHKHKFEKRTEV